MNTTTRTTPSGTGRPGRGAGPAAWRHRLCPQAHQSQRHPGPHPQSPDAQAPDRSAGRPRPHRRPDRDTEPPRLRRGPEPGMGPGAAARQAAVPGNAGCRLLQGVQRSLRSCRGRQVPDRHRAGPERRDLAAFCSLPFESRPFGREVSRRGRSFGQHRRPMRAAAAIRAGSRRLGRPAEGPRAGHRSVPPV